MESFHATIIDARLLFHTPTARLFKWSQAGVLFLWDCIKIKNLAKSIQIRVGDVNALSLVSFSKGILTTIRSALIRRIKRRTAVTRRNNFFPTPNFTWLIWSPDPLSICGNAWSRSPRSFTDDSIWPEAIVIVWFKPCIRTIEWACVDAFPAHISYKVIRCKKLKAGIMMPVNSINDKNWSISYWEWISSLPIITRTYGCSWVGIQCKRIICSYVDLKV